MKTLMHKLLLIPLLIIPSLSYAQDDVSDNVCSGLSDTAGGMMAMRQYERPMSEAIEIQTEIFNESEGDEVDLMFSEMLHEIILHAYSIDVATDDTQKIKTITGFANAYYNVCMQELVF